MEGAAEVLQLLPPAQRLECAELSALLRSGSSLLLLDVRAPELFACGHLRGAINVPATEVCLADAARCAVA